MANFMASQEARLAKFEADFKQKQREMTNKIDTLLKVLDDREMGELPSNKVKNPKLNVNAISLVSSPSSCPPYYSVNSMSTCFKQTQIVQKDHETKISNTYVVKK